MDEHLPPSAAEIGRLAERALDSIPPALRRHLANVAIAVEELAGDELLRELGVESPWDLTGVYQGTPLHRRGADPAPHPDIIVLYRQAILLEWVEEGVDLSRLVANVLIHEAAHHFGFSDADIAALEEGG